MISTIPSPRELGLPSKFDEWRDTQEQMLLDVVNSEKRFSGVAAPTGTGKTAFAIALAKLTKERTVILTKTKGLQQQYMKDFASAGLVNIMGKANYHCEGGSDDWNCERGHKGRCMYLGTPACPSSSAYFTALGENIVVTNFAYWIASNQYGNGLGPVDRLIIDEGHEAYGCIADAMQVRLSKHEVYKMLGSTWPFIANDLGEWKAWAARNKPTCDAELSKWESKIGSTRNPPTSWIDVAHHLSNLSRKLATLVLMSPTSWIVDGTEEGYVLDPIRVSPYAERILFNKVPKVTFLSATIRPKSLNMCGVRSSSMDFFEYASPFPVSNAPVYYVPLAKIYQGSTDADYGAMVSGIDQFMKLRQDRKGLIVCNSYKLTEAIRRRSRFQRNMIFNRQEDNVDDMVQRFKKMPSPHVLISPSISTGYDFPGTEAEYVIIPKVPFPDRSKPIVCAREAIDREYSSHHAMQTIVQAVGRPRRTPTDRCEALIADSNMGWFWQRNHYLAPQSFKDCYQESATLPRPISRSVN